MHRKPDFPPPSDLPSGIEQAAAGWVARHDRGLSANEVRDFTAWADADPRHLFAYERIAGAWGQLDAAETIPEMDALADAVIAQASQRRQNRWRFLRTASAFAAAAAIVVLAVTQVPWRSSPTDSAGPEGRQKPYRVLASTARKQALPDGSVADLNGASRISVDYSPTERRIRLLEGEVHFTVAKNPDRPFIVEVGNVAVKAVGTAFNVKLAPARVEVLVTEGMVEVDDAVHGDSLLASDLPVLQAGQKLIVAAPSETPAAPSVQRFTLGHGDIDHALSWQSTRLVFNDTPLSEVVNAFNRYNVHQLRIGDPKLQTRTLTGVFKADNLDGFLRLLQAGAGVNARPGVPGTTLLLTAR